MTSVKKTKENAVIYVRVSTDDQKEGLSPEVQKRLCIKKTEDSGYKVLEVLDDSGLSGFKEDRPGIVRIKELITKRKISAIVTLSSDRLFRNSRAHMEMMEQIFVNGIQLLYVHQASPENNAPSKMSDGMFSLVNQFYRDQISDKVKATMYEKARSGYYPTRPPIGYKNIVNPDGNANRLARNIIAPDPEMAPLIKELFNSYATGLYNVYDLTDLMISKGLRSHNGFKPFPGRIYDLLKNRIYLGEVRWGPVHNPDGKHEPLIGEATFNRVQAVMESNNHKACRRRKHKWLLAGFVYCASHLKRYVAEWHMPKKVAYYHCSNKTGCGKYSEMTELENSVAEKFKDLQFSDEFIELVIEKARRQHMESAGKHDSRRQSLVNRKTAIESKYKVAENKLFEGIISDEDFTRIRLTAKEEINQIEIELIDLKDKREVDIDVAQEILLLARDIPKAYKKASFDLKRQYLGFFWERFDVADGVIVKSVSSPLFEGLLNAEEAFYKNRQTEKSPKNAGIPAGILSNVLLRE